MDNLIPDLFECAAAPDPNEVTPQRATLLALHAIHVQGGTSDPEWEAERARQQLARSPGSIDWDQMASELAEVAAKGIGAAPSLQPTPAPHVAPVDIDLDQIDPQARIRQLYADYPAAKEEADAAAERLKRITDGIKFELSVAMAGAGVEKVRVRGSGGVPLRLAKVVQMRFNSKRFIKDHGQQVYDAYKAPVESWRLEQDKGGE